MTTTEGTDFWAAIGIGPDDPAPEQEAVREEEAAAGAAPPAADPAWLEAERVAGTIRPRLAEAWIDMLTGEVGDRALARKVFQVLAGMHVLTDLWRDRRVTEIRVHGTRVFVRDPRGEREVPGFHHEAAARQAIATVEAKRELLGAVVIHTGGAVTIRRTARG